MQVRNPIIPDNTRMQSFLIVFKFRKKEKKFKAGQDTENFQRTNVYHALSLGRVVEAQKYFQNNEGSRSKNITFLANSSAKAFIPPRP